MKKNLLILLCLPMIGFTQTTWTPCDSSFAININSQNSFEVIYSVSSSNLNMSSNFSWVYFNMLGSCIGGSAYNSLTDTVNISNNLPDSTTIICLISDSLTSCIVTDTLVFDSIFGWHLTSNMNFDCTDSLQVTDVIVDNSNLTINIAIYNGYNYFLNYPYVSLTIDANGDTIQTGNMNLFGAFNLDTTLYNYSINSVINPSYPLTIYFIYSDGSLVTDTCILTYSTPTTAIINTYISANKKLISIFDVLGRESKEARNEPRFYIYNDGTVEKRIIIDKR